MTRLNFWAAAVMLICWNNRSAFVKYSLSALGLGSHHQVPACARDSVVLNGLKNTAWHDDPKSALANALKRANAEWTVLQALIDPEIDESTNFDSESRDKQNQCAAELLVSSSLDRLRPYVVPAEYIDIPPLRGGFDALHALLDEDAALVESFLSETGPIAASVRVFWQAELYLRRLQDSPGESPVEDAARDAEQTVNRQSEQERRALRGSVLLARQNFVSAVRFGYFLRRSRQRLQLDKNLESLLGGSSPSSDDFLVALREKTRKNQGSQRSQRSLDAYLVKLLPKQAVELVRIASEEARLAVELRAIALFGSDTDLLEEFNSGGGPSQLQLSNLCRMRLNIEAAAFGAALFEAEEAAARLYPLQYSEFGSRNP